MSGRTRNKPVIAAVMALAFLLGAVSPVHARWFFRPRFADGLCLPGHPDYPRVAVERDIPIVMRDGTRLFADVYRPAGRDGKPVESPFPTVLVLVPYVKQMQKAVVEIDRYLALPAGASAVTLSNEFVRHGYVQVIVDVRGTGASEGEWKAWDELEQGDYSEIAQWVTAQPFCDGNLGLYGISYLAIAALLAAEQRPPGLGAVFAVSAAEDLYRDLFRGGDVPYAIVGGLIGIIKALGFLPPGYAGSDPEAAQALYDSRLKGLVWPYEMMEQILNGGELGFDGEFYDLRSPGTRIDQVEVPTFLVGGWFDIYQRGMPRLYQKLRLPPGQKQLLMGPWYHVTIGDGLGRRDTPPRVDTLALMWFDRWLKGIDNGIEQFGPVTSYTLGADRWRSLPDAPGTGEDVEWRRFYLGPEGTLAPDAPRESGWDERRADLCNGWCTRSTTQWTAGALRLGSCETDNRYMEKSALTYTTEPFRRSMHISGPLTLRLEGATTGMDANWIATISDVSPSGESTQITSGALVASRRALDPERSTFTEDGSLVVPYHYFTPETILPVPANEPVPLEIEIFNTDAKIRRGHRLRLTISSSDLPVLGPPFAMSAERKGNVRVHYGPGDTSVLLVPVASKRP